MVCQLAVSGCHTAQKSRFRNRLSTRPPRAANICPAVATQHIAVFRENSLHAMLKTTLRQHLPADSDYREQSWFDSLGLCLEGDTVTVTFPHRYFAVWFSRHKRALFEEALRRSFQDKPPRICYQARQEGEALLSPEPTEPTEPAGPVRANLVDKTNQPNQPNRAALPRRQGTAREAGRARGRKTSAGQEDDFFADFLVNAKNAFPLEAARKLTAREAGSLYNPFVLCGRSGTGKSHILQAVARGFAARYGEGRIIRQEALRFCRERSAMLSRPEFFWQGCTALILDDMQELAGQALWQQQLAALMDACPSGGGQMVFAHAGPSQELKHFEERLHGRLESGLVLELLEPDLDIRLRYLQAISRERQLGLKREQLLYLAQRCAQFRLLQGLSLKLEAFVSMRGKQLSTDDLENIIRTGGVERLPACRDILGAVAGSLNLRAEDILGNKRRADLVFARQMAMYLCRHRLGLSYPELGRAFGGKDHSTVIHAIKKIKKLMETDKTVYRMVTELENRAI